MHTVSDVTRAPAHHPGADGLPWYRRMRLQGGLYVAPGVLFLLIPIFFTKDEPLLVWLYVVATCTLMGFLVIGSTAVAHWGPRARWLWVAGTILTIGLMALAFPQTRPLFHTPFVTTTAAVLLPLRQAQTVILVTTVLVLFGAFLERNLLTVVMAALAMAMGLVIAMAFDVRVTRNRLRASEQRTAVLAVAAERERIGRDLHDILGHSLTAVAVKADLAERLIGRDEQAARAEISELAAIARQSLADVRATASGMQQVRLATEVASARSILTAAGIEAIVSTALPALDDRTSELLGYVVREGVTNVVRHADATTCTISCTRGELTVADDGRGMGEIEGKAMGLSGLKKRVEEAGAVLTVTSGSDGTTLRVTFGERATTKSACRWAGATLPAEEMGP